MKKAIWLFVTSFTLFGFTDCSSNISKITQNAINQFLAITEIPRPAYYHNPMLNYLGKFADSHSFKHSSDDYGNFWMDIPATNGYKNKPKVILQAHTDMVCVHEKDYVIDFEKEGIKAIKDDKNQTITAYKTSLGADDGIGIGIALAIATSNIPHGPIRALFTADEEVGLIGANGVSSKVIDSDYLINIDGENKNEIVYSTAGHLISYHSKTVTRQAAPSGTEKISITISGLMGGHSGTDINKNRLSAATVVSKIFNSFTDQSIDFEICEMDGGDSVNAIATSAETIIAIEESKRKDVESIVKEVVDQYKLDYPNENLKIEIADINDDIKCLSSEDSKEFMALLSSFPQGVIKERDGRVITSSNTGTFTVQDTFCEVNTCSRSHITEDINSIEKKFMANDEKYGYTYEYGSSSPGWDGDTNTKLIQLLKEGYRKSSAEVKLSALHAGSECSWFSHKRDEIELACVGAQISDPHTTKETLHLDTVGPCVKAIIHTLQKL